MSATAPAVDTSPAGKLPKKEGEQFGILINCFDKKDYKKGLKTADGILKKFPEHAETLAMKGMILANTGDKPSGGQLLDQAAKLDPKSYLVWHVYGLYYKQQQNYAKASECFKTSLEFDPHNSNVAKDLSFLQVQIRDFAGFQETRKRVLDQRPNTRANFVAYAVANYLNDQFDTAHETLTNGQAFILSNDPNQKIEDSELILFWNRCLEKAGRFEDAIAQFEEHRARVVDRNTYKIKMAELHQLSGKNAEAKNLWYKLVKSQPDNYRFHCGLQTAILDLSPTVSAEMFALKRLDLPSTELHLSAGQLDMLRQLYAKSNFDSKVIKKLELTLYRGDEPEFRSVLDTYLRGALASGLPSLCHDVCSLFRQQIIPAAGESASSGLARTRCLSEPIEVRAHPICIMVREMVAVYIKNLTEHERFDSSSDGKAVNPQALLWALFLQCHLQEKCGFLREAMQSIEKCIEHTPTALDMLCKKAQLLKMQGDFVQAAETMDSCRALDLQDRYLNNKATKYFLRANELEKGSSTIAMFTKHDGDPQKTLFDLQVAWYELEVGDANFRLKQWGEALRKYFAIKHHFNTHHDDMYDFHGYCIRKTTVRAYTECLQNQDKATAHKYFQRAFRGAVGIFLHLIDVPEDIDGLGYMIPADRKKEREKRKKAAKKKEQDKEKLIKAAEAGDEEAAAAVAAEKDKKPAERADGDVEGDALLAKDYLTQAAEWCACLDGRLALCEPDTLAMVSDVHLRRGMILQSLKAVSLGLHKDRSHPALNVALMKLACKIRGPKKVPDLSKVVGHSVREGLFALLQLLKVGPADAAPTNITLDIASFVHLYIAHAQSLNSLPHSMAAIEIVHLFQASQVKPAEGSAEATDLKTKITAIASDAALWREGRAMSFKNVKAALRYMEINMPSDAGYAAFHSHALELFPHVAPSVAEESAAKV